MAEAARSNPCPREGCLGTLMRGLDGDLECMHCHRTFVERPDGMIPPTKVVIGPKDRAEILAYIDEAMKRGFLAQGQMVEAFEDAFAKYVGTRHAVATSTGGAALEMVLRSIGAGWGDGEVLVPANTFVASATSVVMAGAHPVFVDITEETLAPSISHLEAGVSERTKALILVHVGGLITPQIEAIRNWCQQHGIYLIEDCAHAHGSRFKNRAAGSFGIAGCYSFFGTKVMTSGEGGMVVTDDDDLADELRVMRDYGKPERWTSYHTMLGANWRMNELEASVGYVQLKSLDEMIDWRRQVAETYDQLLSGRQRFGEDHVFDLPLELPGVKGRRSWYKYIVLLPEGVDRERVKEAMQEWDVTPAGGVFDIPLHQQPVFADNDVSLPNTERFAARHLCLPIYYRMTEGEVHSVVRALYEALKEQLGEAQERVTA